MMAPTPSTRTSITGRPTPDDKGWYSKDPRWHLEWFARIKDLVDQYHPDLLYTDGGVPFGNEVGLSMIAHHYNSSAGRNDGKADVVYTCKQNSEGMWAVVSRPRRSADRRVSR